MPSNILGGLFSTLSQKAHDKAQEERGKQDKSREAEIGVWKSVLENPASSEEQRQKAVDSLNKLYNWKGKGDSPFQRLAGFMKHVGARLQQGGGQAKEATIQGQPQDFPAAGGDNKNAAPKPDTSDIGQGKTNVAKKILGKAASGLGAGMDAVSSAINPHPKELPPLDAKSIPSGAQEDKHKLEYLDKELAIKNKYIKEQIDERNKGVREKARVAQQSKIRIPGNAVIGAFPKDQIDTLVDESGLPIDPNGIYAPTDGSTLGVDTSVEGKPMLNAVRVGTGPARESDYGTWMYDTKTQRMVEMPTHRESNAPGAPQVPTKTTGQEGSAEKPKTLPDLKGKAGEKKPQAAKPAGGRGDKIHVAPEGFIRTQMFNPLYKSATATDEARNSLVGDDPNVEAGLMGDLDIYDDPKSVERVRNYLGFVEKNIGATSVGSGQGFISGAEWLIGLPQAINDLQQRGLQQYAEKLTPAERRFVSDYFRVMGTIGGMRASTGAPAAKWSFQTLFNELPTPGLVINKEDARRRINNLIQETNVVSKRNPMSQKIPVNQDKQDNQINLSPESRKILEKHGILPKATEKK